MCASDHNLWRNYTLVATRCRGTLDLSPHICKTPNRRVAVISPVTFAPWGTSPERGLGAPLNGAGGPDSHHGVAHKHGVPHQVAGVHEPRAASGAFTHFGLGDRHVGLRSNRMDRLAHIPAHIPLPRTSVTTPAAGNP